MTHRPSSRSPRRAGRGARRFTAACLLAALIAGAPTAPAAPLAVTHFFDWYSPSTPQEQFTHKIDWAAHGIDPAEVGVSLNYYVKQFELIRQTGFDGIVYEWYGIQPKPVVIDALNQTGLRAGIFYDLAIRYNGQAALQPDAASAQRLVADVLSFYERIPDALRLRDGQGRLVMTFYAFPFDLSSYASAPWATFFSTLARGLEDGIASQVRVYWTGLHAIQPMHGLLHHEEFSPLNFNPFEGQTQIDARAVCWAFNYDDRGAVIQGRADRLIQLDPDYLEEGFWLALHSEPELIFNYGWNEYFEGENIMPDMTFGDFRRQTIQSMLATVPARAVPPASRAVVLVDDLLPAYEERTGRREPWVALEFGLLYLVRAFLPHADVRIATSVSFADLGGYDTIVALNRFKDATQDAWLAALAPTHRILYLNPATRPATPMTALFTESPRSAAFPDAGPGSENEWIEVRRNVSIDLNACPRLRLRVRNSPGGLFHVRLYGVDAGGSLHTAWTEDSPLDDETTEGQWETREVNADQLADAAAGTDIVRITSIQLILDDVENGQLTADFDTLEFLPLGGDSPCWSDDFSQPGRWELGRSSGVRITDAAWELTTEEGAVFSRLRLLADDPRKLNVQIGGQTVAEIPAGDHIQLILPRPEVEVAATLQQDARTAPAVLFRDDDAWVNYYAAEGDLLWDLVFRRWTGREGRSDGKYGLANLVRIANYLANGSVSRIAQRRWSRIEREPLPIHPIPPMPLAGFYPWSQQHTTGTPITVRWLAGGADADGSIARYEAAIDGVADGRPNGPFQTVAADEIDSFGGGSITIPALPDGGYEIWVRAVDQEGNPGFLQEPLYLEVDTTPPPAPTALRAVPRRMAGRDRVQIEALFPEDAGTGLARMEYSLDSRIDGRPDAAWGPVAAWSAADPDNAAGDIWVQAESYVDGSWAAASALGVQAIRPERYLYVFWDDAHYNRRALDLFARIWTPAPNRVRIWYVQSPGGPANFHFTAPVPIERAQEWTWVRIPVPAHDGDGNGGDLARLEGFDSGLLLASFVPRLADGRVRFLLPELPAGAYEALLRSVDGVGLISELASVAFTVGRLPAEWSLH